MNSDWIETILYFWYWVYDTKESSRPRFSINNHCPRQCLIHWWFILSEDQTQNDTFEFLLNVQKYSFIYQQLYFIHSFPSFIFNSFLSFILFFHFFFFFIFYIFFKITLKGDFLASYISFGRTNPTYVIISRGEAAEGTGVPRCTTGTMQAVRIRETQENWTHPLVSGKIACWRPGTGNQSLRPLLAGHCLYFLSFLSVLFL